MAAFRRAIGLIVAVAGVVAALCLTWIGIVASDEGAKWGGALPAAVQGCMLLAAVGLAGFLFAKD